MNEDKKSVPVLEKYQQDSGTFILADVFGAPLRRGLLLLQSAMRVSEFSGCAER